MFGFIALFFVAGIAFALSAVSGGGAGLIVMPVLGLLLVADHVPAALSIGTAVSSASRIALFFDSIRWHVVLRFVPLALPAAWGGVLLLKQLEPAYLDFFLGLFLLGNLPLMLRRRKANDVVQSSGIIVWLPVIGAQAGFISGFTGAVGLLFNRFYHQLGLRKEEIVATRAANDVLLHFVKVILYATYGLIDRAALMAGLIVSLAALTSSCLMKLSLRHIPDQLFRQVGHAAAVAAGVAMMVLAGHQIAAQDRLGIHYSQASDAVEMALDWRQHRLSFELERPVELEIHHDLHFYDVAPADSSNVRQIPRSTLHVSPTHGIYLTRSARSSVDASDI